MTTCENADIPHGLRKLSALYCGSQNENTNPKLCFLTQPIG